MDPNDVNGQLVQSFTVTYGSGGIRGNAASDHFSLNTLLLPALLFGEVTSEDSTIAGFDMDGIVGLGFDGLASVTKPGILNSMKLNYPNLSQSFSLYLSSDPDDHTKPSKITFGNHDLSIVGQNASFYYTPVMRYSEILTYWTVSMTGFEIGTSAPFVTASEVEVTLSVCTYG
jgi:cathepsin D